MTKPVGLFAQLTPEQQEGALRFPLDDCQNERPVRLVPRYDPEPPVILGLVGPSGGGKTTVCDHLKATHGFTYLHVADPLKRGFQAMFGVGPEYCERPLIEKRAWFLGGVAPRHVFEHLGTRLHEIAPRALPLAAQERVGALIADDRSARVIVDGIRRVSEAAAVREMGAHVIRIAGRPIDEAKPCDVSQAEVEADFILDYTPHLDQLRDQIDSIVAQLTWARAR